MTKLEKIKKQFYVQEGKLSLASFGVYNRGLTKEEIVEYLKARANKLSIKKELKQFNELLSGSTCGSTTVFNAKGKKEIKLLIYRHDVERFADVVFDNIPTYFD